MAVCHGTHQIRSLHRSAPRSADAELGDAAKLAEQLGFRRAVARRLAGARQGSTPVLAATDRLVAATGIVNVWSTPPDVAAAQHHELATAYPDRFLLGIGIGHREATAEYQRPLAVMNEYLDALDAAPTPVPKEQRCIAALGPKMLDLSRERTLGTHPYFSSVEHTRAARERLGQGPLIALSIACVVDTDAERGRASARSYAAMYLTLSNYTNNLLRTRVHRVRHRRRRLGSPDRHADPARQPPSTSRRPSTSTSTPAPITSACRSSSFRASRVIRGPSWPPRWSCEHRLGLARALRVARCPRADRHDAARGAVRARAEPRERHHQATAAQPRRRQRAAGAADRDPGAAGDRRRAVPAARARLRATVARRERCRRW